MPKLRARNPAGPAPRTTGKSGKMQRIYLVGTADTKGAELRFLAGAIRAQGGNPVVVDVGIRVPSLHPDIPGSEVADFGSPGFSSSPPGLMAHTCPGGSGSLSIASSLCNSGVATNCSTPSVPSV